MNELSEAWGVPLRYHGGKEVQDMKYLKIFTDFLEVTASLGDGALGRLFRAMLRYALDGTELPLKGKEGVLWTVARQQIDREKEAYENKVNSMERCREAKKQKEIKQRSIPQSKISAEDKDKEKEKEKDKDKEEDKDSLSAGGAPGAERENRPTLAEVMAFSQEAGLQVDVQYFFHYYEANGWHIGKQPIRSWKAALRAWAKKAPPAPALSDKEVFRQAIELHRLKEAKRI